MIIVLSICKIFGILLLVLVCILALILFIPISYELDVDIDKKSCNVRVNWMFRLIRFRFRYHEKIEAVLSVLFFKIDFTDPESRAKREKKKAKKALKKEKKVHAAYEKQAAKKKREAEKKKKAYQKKRKKYREQQKVNQEESAVESPSEQKGILEKDRIEYPDTKQQTKASDIGEWNSKTGSESVTTDDSVLDNFEPDSRSGIREKLADGSKKAKNALGMIQKLKDFLHKVSEYGIIGIIFPKLQVFLVRIRPRILKGCIEFGLEDPATTGQIVGGIAMIPLFYQTDLRIIPDFEAEDAYIKGHIYTRGYILCVHVIILIIQLVKEKNIRRFISEIKKKK